MMATRNTLTAEEFDNLDFAEDKRYELDEGELVEMTKPAYIHNRILKNLGFELESYLRKHRVGEFLISENLYALSSSVRRAPDAAVILGDRQAELKTATVIPIVPEIVVEIISRSETPRQIHRKLRQYFEAGVKEAWVVYPESRTVEIWTGLALPDRELTEGEAIASKLLPEFQLHIADLFS